MKSKIFLPPPGEFQEADVYSRKRRRRVQFHLNVFWSKFQRPGHLMETAGNKEVQAQLTDARDEPNGDQLTLQEVDDSSALQQCLPQTLVLMIDDLQHADEHSCSFLKELVAYKTRPVLLILSARGEEVSLAGRYFLSHDRLFTNMLLLHQLNGCRMHIYLVMSSRW